MATFPVSEPVAKFRQKSANVAVGELLVEVIWLTRNMGGSEEARNQRRAEAKVEFESFLKRSLAETALSVFAPVPAANGVTTIRDLATLRLLERVMHFRAVPRS